MEEEQLKSALERARAEMEALRAAHGAEMEKLRVEQETAMEAMRTAYEREREAHAEALEKAQSGYETEKAALRKSAAIDLALVRAGARNARAVRALLDEGAVTLADDGTAEGLGAQLEALRESEPYLFAEQKAAVPRVVSFWPGESADMLPRTAPDPAHMTYSQMAAMLERGE